MSTQSHAAYRPDIDGLRAIAVGSVVLFHAFPAKLPGGYVGVDIFFVISGYLISRLIFESLRDGRFSYAQFYARRVRRILPALLIVLAVTLAVDASILPPREYLELGRQTIAGVGFFSNILFWTESGYFDAARQLKPLLHLWSLGIEEQFYLTWPLILAFLFRRTRWLPWIIGIFAIISFGLNIQSVGRDPSGAFYLPQTRYWELLIGAMLAYAAVFATDARIAIEGTPNLMRTVTTEALSALGLLLIGISLIAFDERLSFPGWWALLPTIGACCIIGARDAWINRRVLANSVLVFFGLISYPLYLWHWVLLTGLMRQYHWQVSRNDRIGVVVLSVLLAWLTFVCIEKPLRFGGRAQIRVVQLATLAAIIGCVGLFVDLSDGVAFRYPTEIRRLATYSYDAHRDYREDICQLDGERSFSELGAQCIDSPKSGSRLLMLWGDSHASSLYQGLRWVQARAPGLRLGQFTASGCPPLLEVRLGIRKTCKEFMEASFKRIGEIRPAIVVMEGAWENYASSPADEKTELAAMRATVVRLQQAGVSRIVVVGDLPVWDIWQPDVAVAIWRESHQMPERTYAYFEPSSNRIDAEIKQSILGTSAVFVSPIESLCNVQGCLLYASDAFHTPITWDTAHLTAAGSRMLVGLNVNRILGDGPTMARSYARLTATPSDSDDPRSVTDYPRDSEIAMLKRSRQAMSAGH